MVLKRMGIFLVAGLLALPVGSAFGQNNQGQNNNNQGQGTRSAPGISPAALPAIAAMLAGFSLLMTHGRKSVRSV